MRPRSRTSGTSARLGGDEVGILLQDGTADRAAKIADSLRQAKNSAGRPLVQSEQVLVPHRIAPEPVEAPRRWWPWRRAG